MQIDPSLNFLPKQGEASQHLRALDWGTSSIGAPQAWPETLRTSLSLCLSSRFPILIWWGSDLSILYNDAYIPFLGANKHPAALARPGKECWSEIWDSVGPMLESVMRTGEATWSYDAEYFFDRALPREEVYVTFTYGPILSADGLTTEGVFCPCTETTEKIVSARRLEMLRQLGEQGAPKPGAQGAAQRVCDVLAQGQRDVPFCLIYGCADGEPTLLASTGVPEAAQAPALWPLADTEPQTIALAELGLTLPGGPWDDDAVWARVQPVRWTADGSISGVMVMGVSARRPLDAAYQSFLDLVAQHAAGAIANAVAHEEEARRIEALAELDRAKTAFFSNVSHEFRTPLTLILAPLEQALMESDGRIDKTSSELLFRNALRLQKLVNSLLDFSRIEGGAMAARAAPLDLAQLTADHASVFRSMIESAGLALNVHCDATRGPVQMDPDHYEKIVLNLLSNAFKYTRQGSIDVNLQDAGAQVVLTVRDTGLGISAADLPLIFQRFHRGETPTARSHEGSGIGLALVLELVKLHQGDITVDSEPGGGSVFTVTFPKSHCALPPVANAGDAAALRPPSETARQHLQEMSRWRAAETPEPVHAPDGARARVLCADDNADLRDYIHSLLAPHYDVQMVPDGAAALRSAQQDPPDLVITDVMMPGMSGLSLLEALRDDERTRTVPVILLSARAGPEARVQGMEAGADDYLIKPFSPSELRARVAAHLRLSLLRKDVENTLRDAHARKDEFLAILAHELRNPLAPLHNGLHLLHRSGPFDDKTTRIHRMLDRQVNHIARLVDDLLDIARITNGKIQLQRAPVNLVAMLQHAVDACQPSINEAGHTLQVSMPEGPVMMDADEVRLTQVVSNLLNNASKYTERGGHIDLRATLEPDGCFQVSVRDNGRGIPASMLKKVFEPFVQVNGEGVASGLGIGLALVRRLAELHGGTVLARSAGLGAGSEFLLRLPVAVASDAPATAAAAPDFALGRVLVVDDNRDSGDTSGMVLEAFGADVRVVRDGPAALALLPAFEPTVMLVDLGMPGMDGYEVARRVRQHLQGRPMLLIAMTGWGQDDDRRRSELAGFDHHLVKPVDFDALEKLLTDFANRE